jgi:hypothetical protein
MPWKNGGGETLEIAAYPSGASLVDFGWRISMAHVASDGPFSVFPGVDRTLTILAGAGLRLTVGNQQVVTLTRESTPYAFAGEADTRSTLIDGPVTDLNVMSRRAAHRHDVQRSRLVADLELELHAAITAIFVDEGTVDVAAEKKSAALESSDTALIPRSSGSARLQGRAPASLILIHID